MKLSECMTKGGGGGGGLLSFISQLCCTHTARLILLMWRAWCCLNPLDSLLLGMRAGYKRRQYLVLSPALFSYHEPCCPLFGGVWAGQKPWIAHHLSCVIIRLIEARSPNTSWHTYYWCNSPRRDTSLAWWTQARIRVKTTPDPFNCWRESDWIRNLRNRKDQKCMKRNIASPVPNYQSCHGALRG